MQTVVTDDLDALLDVLPTHIRQALLQLPDNNELLEIIMDLAVVLKLVIPRGKKYSV